MTLFVIGTCTDHLSLNRTHPSVFGCSLILHLGGTQGHPKTRKALQPVQNFLLGVIDMRPDRMPLIGPKEEIENAIKEILIRIHSESNTTIPQGYVAFTSYVEENAPELQIEITYCEHPRMLEKVSHTIQRVVRRQFTKERNKQLKEIKERKEKEEKEKKN